MHKSFFWRMLSVCGALLCALGIMATSLLAAGKAQSNDMTRSTTKKFYVGSQILPDHVLYPVFMALDRTVLVLSPGSQKIDLQIAFAHKRLEATKALFDKGENELALSTMTKAQKYMLAAAQAALVPSTKQRLRRQVAGAIENHLSEIKSCRTQHVEIEGHEVDRLVAELEIARDNLKNAVASNAF